MITEDKCYSGYCDNCGEIFNDGEYSMFPLEADVKYQMQNSDWYADGTDPDHKGKHYCPDCFTYHIEIDDKIVVDSSRYKPAPPESQESKGGEGDKTDMGVYENYLRETTVTQSPSSIEESGLKEGEERRLNRQEDNNEHLGKCLQMLKFLYMNEYCGDHGEEVRKLIMPRPHRNPNH